MKYSRNQIENQLNNFKTNLIRLNALYDETFRRFNTKIEKCKDLEESANILTAVHQLMEQCNIVSRDFVRVEVEKLVTQGLRSIFEKPDITFNITFESKRNQVEAKFWLSREGAETSPIQGDILSTYGGGLVDIIGISLRIILRRLLKTSGPLILDEPGKNVSEQYIDNLGKFLLQVSQMFSQQIIMITHNGKLAEYANKTINISQINRVSYVK